MGEPVTLQLPYPISANRYWRSFVPKGHARAIVTLSDEARAYKHQVGWYAKKLGLAAPITGRVHVDIKLFPQRPQDWAKRAARDPLAWDDSVQCLDLDNANKVLFDALKGIVIEDDRWVRRITAERMEPDGEGRVLVTITPIARQVHPQGELLGTA